MPPSALEVYQQGEAFRRWIGGFVLSCLTCISPCMNVCTYASFFIRGEWGKTTTTHNPPHQIIGSLEQIAATHNAVLQRLHPRVELPLVRPYLEKFDKARKQCFRLFLYGGVGFVYFSSIDRPTWRSLPSPTPKQTMLITISTSTETPFSVLGGGGGPGPAAVDGRGGQHPRLHRRGDREGTCVTCVCASVLCVLGGKES